MKTRDWEEIASDTNTFLLSSKISLSQFLLDHQMLILKLKNLLCFIKIEKRK